jgi:Uma2 family endonuclease
MLTLELLPHEAQKAKNVSRWSELIGDQNLAQFEGRIETDRHGHVVLSPVPAASHGSFQAEIAFLLRSLMPDGRVLAECPISTADGVKAADVAWASTARIRDLGDNICFLEAPEICLEVLSPGNTKAEMREKAELYFDAGAAEVWHCEENGDMSFIGIGMIPLPTSTLCPKFPAQVKLR